MEIDDSSVILDVATGTGDLAILALKKNASRVYGLDPAFEMIKKTSKKLEDFSDRFRAIEGFGEYLPFKPSLFSHVMISYGIRNISDRKKALSEFHRVLKNKGTFAVLEFSKTGVPWFHYLYKYYFEHVLTRIGGWISGDREAYEYLPRSVSQFPSRDIFIQECMDSGFKLKSVNTIFFGVSTVYLFQK
jgi:demethylmenaquinone methyltransferase/2-methoxy-6-polyprenyl-1,4-benzoquinol methylase